MSSINLLKKMSTVTLLRKMEDNEEWKRIQERTFTNWFNDRLRGNLKVAEKQIHSLETDLEDGLMLIELLNKLAAPKAVGRFNKNPKQKVQKMENLGAALQFIRDENIKLVNIGPEDIYEGNMKLILGLIWTLIKAYQIKLSSDSISTNNAMLTWVNSFAPECHVTNFSTNWNSGQSISGVINHIHPGAFPDRPVLSQLSSLDNCRLGMDLAETLLGIPKILSPEDLNSPSVDMLSVMTYISYFCNPANQLLIDWIRKKIPDNNITNLSTDWNNGINLKALVEACFPALCPNWDNMKPTDAVKNNQRLLELLKDRLGLVCPVTAAELADPKVDELIVATYLSQFRNAKLKTSPEELSLDIPAPATGSAEQMANFKDICITARGSSADVKMNLKPKERYNLQAVFVPTKADSYDIMVDLNKALSYSSKLYACSILAMARNPVYISVKH